MVSKRLFQKSFLRYWILLNWLRIGVQRRADVKAVQRVFISLKARNFLNAIFCYDEETENMLHAVLRLFCHIFIY